MIKVTKMESGSRSFENAVAVRVIRLGAAAQGVSLGLVCALGVFVATNWLLIKGGQDVGRHLSLLNQYFIGYDVTFVGSLVGAAYGFVVGFIFGYIIATTYNLIATRRS
jgi:hypothetical protein